MNSSMPCGANVDNQFGPLVHCRSSFDFTLLFEDGFLSIAPSALLLLLAPIRVSFLFKKPRIIDGHNFEIVKLISIFALGAVQLALLVLWSVPSAASLRTKASIASAALSFVAALIFPVLSYLEHLKSLRPSSLLSAYLFFAVLFDASRVRTLWLIHLDTKIATLFTISFGLKLLILSLEATEKRRYLPAEEKASYSREETSGILGQALFVWLNRLIVDGSRKILSLSDLYPLDPGMKTHKLQEKFQRDWARDHENDKLKLYRTVFASMKWQILAPIPARMALIAFTICQPLLLNSLLIYLNDPPSPNHKNHGYGFMAAYFIVYLGIATSTSFYWHAVNRSIAILRGTLVSAIYKKATEISITDLDDNAAVTLMSTDIERIVAGFRASHEIWANAIQVGIATWLLQRQLGLAWISPLLVSVVSIVGGGGLGGLAETFQQEWMKVLQQRVGITSTMISAMKGVKMTGLTPKLGGLIQGLRLGELKTASKFRRCFTGFLTIAYIPNCLAPFLALAIFTARSSQALSDTRAFTALSLIQLVSAPLMELVVDNIMPLAGAVGCFNRVRVFLMADSRVDPRITRSAPLKTLSISEKLKSQDTATQPTSNRIEERFDSVENTNIVIDLQNGSFGWVADKLVLKDLNIKFERSMLTMIVGPVACGKSTLLKGLLGELPYSEGSVHLFHEGADSTVAFCDQTPWLLYVSIRDNIINFSEYDAAWYQVVAYTCALEDDFKTFPQGDQSIVGSNGITLSGGQKQRLAIARAVYSRAKIAVFDDVFSGQDSTTQEFLFNHLFRPTGILRDSQTTVIMSTHSVELLPSADRIVALDESGSVIEQGTFEKLNAHQGYVNSLSINNTSSTNDQENDGKSDSKDATIQRTFEVAPATAIGDTIRQSGDVLVYKFYCDSVGRWWCALFVATMVAFAFLYVFPTIWIKIWTSNNVGHPNQHLAYYLGIYGTLQALCLLVAASCGWQMGSVFMVKSGANLHWQTLKAVIGAPMSFFAKADVGEITNRFSQDIELIDGELPMMLTMTIFNVFLVTAQAGSIAAASAYIVISFPFVCAVLYSLQKFYLRTSRQLRFMDLEAKSPLYTQFLETLNGLSHIRAFGWQNENRLKNDMLLDTSQRPFYQLFMIQQWLNLILQLITGGMAFLVVVLAVRLQSVSAGFTGVALVNIIGLALNMQDVINSWTKLETSLGAVSRVKNFPALTGDENVPEADHLAPEGWPSNGTIEFRDVSAAYKPEDGDVLKNINLSVKAGERLGICGKSGSGKSSLVLALFRMLDLNKGAIIIDGEDISQIPRQDIRFRLNAIPQDPYFLYGTVRLNLDPHEDSTDELIIRALEKVELWSILERKGGLDAVLNSDSLSHGQRQLFCLARSILRGSKMVVLDEATSSVDHKTDELMQRIIREDFGNKTIIAIAHRLETIIDFDRIAVLDRGTLVECDTPAALLARQSAFKQLYSTYKSEKKEEVVE